MYHCLRTCHIHSSQWLIGSKFVDSWKKKPTQWNSFSIDTPKKKGKVSKKKKNPLIKQINNRAFVCTLMKVDSQTSIHPSIERFHLLSCFFFLNFYCFSLKNVSDPCLQASIIPHMMAMIWYFCFVAFICPSNLFMLLIYFFFLRFQCYFFL